MPSLVSIFITITIFSATLKLSQATSHVTFNITNHHHKQWMNQFSRVYSNELEQKARFDVFKNNLRFIENFNKEGNRTYKLGVNKFADWSEDEFIATHTGLKGVNNENSPKEWFHEMMVVAPSWNWNREDDHDQVSDDFGESKDWRYEGAVTPVRYQGPCGGCWAFSAVAAIEGLTKITQGNLVPLSEQQLIDCDIGYFDNGCRGGIMSEAFKYIIQNGGIASEESYPFQGYQGMCWPNARPVASIRGFQTVPRDNERALLEAVSRQPVSVSIDAYGPGFMHYSGGVYDEPYCGTRVNHAVTFVGYGVSQDGVKYWLAKNSWGESWGENGYIRIRRDVDWPQGMCGLAQYAFYPIV